MTTLHDFGGVLGRPLDTFFGLSQFHGHGSWLVCEVALRSFLLVDNHGRLVVIFGRQVIGAKLNTFPLRS